ncbi:hypothetical protein COCNU_scaffold005294G000020 [Cocos nucifera]|nr:hypothetical protein [Cocos nucifera]
MEGGRLKKAYLLIRRNSFMMDSAGGNHPEEMRLKKIIRLGCDWGKGPVGVHWRNSVDQRLEEIGLLGSCPAIEKKMTSEERNNLAKGIKSLKRKAAPVPEADVIAPTPTLSQEDAAPTPSKQHEVIEKKKKKKKNVIRKRIRMIENSSSEGFDQERAFLDDRKVVQSLMKGSILPHIIDKMVGKEDAERFDESFAAYLEVTILPKLIQMKDALSKF